MKKKIGIIIAVVVVILVVVIVINNANRKRLNEIYGGENQNKGAILIDVEKGSLEDSKTLSGTIISGNHSAIQTAITSKAIKVNVSLGSYVQEGDVLVEFDKTEYQKAYDKLVQSNNSSNNKANRTREKLIAAVDEAKQERETSLKEASEAIDTAKNNLEEYKAALEEATATLNEYTTRRDAAYASYESATDSNEAAGFLAQYETFVNLANAATEKVDSYSAMIIEGESAVKEAEKAYKQIDKQTQEAIDDASDALLDIEGSTEDSTKEELEIANEMLEACTVKAPSSGVITMIDIEEGATAREGVIITIDDISTLKLNVEVSEEEILSVKEGAKATLTATATGNKTYEGEIVKVSRIKNAESNSYPAEIVINDKDTELLPGMSAKASVILNSVNDALIVPFDAITDLNEDTGIVYVATDISGNKTTLKAVEVKVIFNASGSVAIEGDGIDENDKIVFNPLVINASDGATVELNNYDVGELYE